MPPWISARLIGYAAAAVACAMMLAAWQHRGAQLERARTVAAECSARYAVLSAQVEEQNAAVAEYRRRGELQQQAADAAQAQAQAQLQATQKRLQTILTARVPADCPAAMAWAREQAADIGARWAQGAGP